MINVQVFDTSIAVGIACFTLGCGGGSGASAGQTSAAPTGCEGALVFPDPAVDAAVRDAIEMPSGDVRHENVSELSELSVWRGEEDLASDLSGMECLSGLTWLDLNSNAISNLEPLSELAGLTELVLGYNNISDLRPLANLSSLELLWLNDNAISDLEPLSELTALIELDLGYNSIRDLRPLANLSSLELLWLNDNAVSDVEPLSGLTSLVELDLAGNEISDLAGLVANAGFGANDNVYLEDNPMNCSDQAADIRNLEDRGANVYTDCP